MNQCLYNENLGGSPFGRRVTKNRSGRRGLNPNFFADVRQRFCGLLYKPSSVMI